MQGLGVLSKVDSMIHQRASEKCHRKVGRDQKCYKHFRVAETKHEAGNEVRGRQVPHTVIPIPPTFMLQVTFSTPFVTSFEPSSTLRHLPLSGKHKTYIHAPSRFSNSKSLSLEPEATGSVPPPQDSNLCSLEWGLLGGKRSNRYLALALKTLSFNPKTLTGTVFFP